MLIPPKFFLNSKIIELLQSIEGSREVINSIQIPPEVENNIRRKSSLKSSLFSARIEGNTLSLETLQIGSSKDQKRIEVFNILKSLNIINSRGIKNVTSTEILNFHKISMQGISDKVDLGKFRTNMEAIFNSSGIAIYLPPRPNQIGPLIDRLIKFINGPKESFIPIKAALVHYSFEKIHPFLDGNGRVGRLLMLIVLQKYGYGMKGLLAIEEYLDNHRSQYYEYLDQSEKDVTEYLQFMLEAIAKSAEIAKKEVLEKKNADIEELLLPRRNEILNIIKDHQLVTFDTIQRRFMAVNERTLRYDLKKLADQGLIKKRGTTKGVWYEPVKISLSRN